MNRTPSNQSVAVIILNFNGKTHLEKFLPSVVDSTTDNCSIYVADNGSTDGSISFLRDNFEQVSLIVLGKNYGFAEGYNRAISMVSEEYVILLNSDVEVTNGWIDNLLGLIVSNPAVAAVQPKILSFNEKSKFEHAGAAGGMIDFLGYPFCRGRIFLHTETDSGQYNSMREIFWASGAAMCVRRKNFIDLGGFDGDYFAHMEEIDLCWRLKRAGYSVLYEPKSVVYHLGGGTLNYESSFKVYLNFRNSIYTIFKNVAISKLIWLLPVRLILDGVAGVFYLSQGKFDLILMIIKAHFSFYGAFFKLLKKRKSYNLKIKQFSIGIENKNGYFSKSIVYQHFINKKRTFGEIFSS